MTETSDTPQQRREFLANIGGGFAGIALAQLLGQGESSANAKDLNGGMHHPAKVKRIVQLFMNGQPWDLRASL